MVSRGLVTLERAHLGGTSTRPPDAAKLTIYVGRQDRADGRPAHRAVCDVLHRHGFAGASVFLGVDGTARGQRRRARFFSRNMGVPVMIIAVGTGSQVADALPELETLLREPLFTIERAQLCKRDGELLARPAALPATDDHGRALWQKLMVYTSEAALHDGTPIHRAIVQRLLESRAAGGATVLRGIWGFHGDHEPHGDKLIQLARRVPVTTIVVDAPERIAASFDIIDRLTGAARAGDQRAGSRAGVDRRRRAPRRHRAGASPVLIDGHSLARFTRNSIVPVGTTFTKPAKSGGVTPKSVHVTGTEPAAMTVSPARWTFTFAVTSRAVPLIVMLPGTSTVTAAPVSGTAASVDRLCRLELGGREPRDIHDVATAELAVACALRRGDRRDVDGEVGLRKLGLGDHHLARDFGGPPVDRERRAPQRLVDAITRLRAVGLVARPGTTVQVPLMSVVAASVCDGSASSGSASPAMNSR